MVEVLLVDDDPTVLEVVQAYLERAGFTVASAADGVSGLQLARTHEPALVVLDVMLPGLDGIEICRALRRDSPAPIVMLSALGSESERVLGLEVGADDYVTKPFSPRELVLRLQSVLRRAGGGDPAREAAGPVVDGDLLVRLSAGLLQLHPERVALGNVVEEAVALAEPLAHRRRVSVTTSADADAPVEVDIRSLTRAVANLLVNAIRHTPTGGAVVVSAGRDGDGGGVVSVADQCGGIPDGDLAHVFDIGFQGDAARSPGSAAGAGLGLAIVRGIVEAHGGLVSVVNGLDGCRFDLRVPLAPDVPTSA